jgi:hypothetical protein
MEHNTPYHHATQRGNHGSKSAWRCKRYSEKGTAGCTSPTIYTSELDDIMRHILDTVFKDRKQIIDEMIKTYSDISMGSTIKEDIGKLRVKINELTEMKDKLLTLSVKGKISDDEFETRNNKFNSKIESLQTQIAEYEQQEEQNKDFEKQISNLRKIIDNELSFDEAMGDGVVAELLDRIEAYKTNEKNKVSLKVFLKVTDDSIDCNVKKQRSKPTIMSFDTTQKSGGS